MPFILGANETKVTGYNVANSVRFDGSSSYMSFAPASHMNMDRWTWSCWVKRSKLGAVQTLFNCDNAASDLTELQFLATDQLHFENLVSNSIKGKRVTTRVFRDVSSWMHIMVVWDSGNATAGDRIKIYINGVQETSFDTSDDPDQNTDSSFGENNQPIRIGVLDESNDYFGGYMCEVVVLDGTAAAVTDFGEFNEDSPRIWQPIDVSGLTFGSQGFYLDFEDSGDLGDDESGNGNDFAETNLAATDQSTDTCTNNAITMNSLDHSATHNSTFSEGNLKVVTSASGSPPHFATIGLTTGKWYWEVKATSFTEHSAGYITIGITANQGNSTTNQLGHLTNDYAFVNNGNIEAGTGNDTSYGNSYTQGQIIGTYLDLDNNKLYFSINGTLQNSGTGHSITAASSTTNGFYMPSFSDYSSSSSNLVTVEWNFGAGTTFAISSGNTDGEYGNFEYSTTITGDGASKTFKAINSKNLAEFG